MPMPSSEIMVLGAGVNGIACAARLAQAGARVTVLEAEAEVGGAARTVEFAPGYRASAVAHLMPRLDRRMAKALDVERHGLTFAARDIATTILGAGGARRRVTLQGAEGPDSAAWANMMVRLGRHAAALAPFREMTPPRLKGPGNEWGKLIRAALRLRLLGRDDLRDLMRLLLINVADLAEDDLTDPLLQVLLAHDATLGAWAGPRSPNTLILYLNRLALGPGLSLPVGGMGAMSKALRQAAEAAGVAFRTNTRVARIETSADRVTGIRLGDGTFAPCDTVVSALSPRTTFLDLVGGDQTETGHLRRFRAIRERGGAARLTLALTALPDFSAEPGDRLVIADSVDAIEVAWNPAKYGEVPARPVIEAVIPSVQDATLAPDGHHVMTAIVQFAPSAPRDPEVARKTLLTNALAVLEEQAPGIGRLVAHAELQLPGDLTARFGIGAWHHAELSVEQMLFNRPTLATSRYETPIEGLWLASAGSHPGGWVTGTVGWNAAEAILAGGVQ